MRSEEHQVAVIGAGIAGLQSALLLAQALPTCKVHVLEARDRIGGRTLTKTDSVMNTPVDLGGTWIWPSENPSLAKFVQQHDIPLIPEVDGSAYRFREGSGVIAKTLAQELQSLPNTNIVLNAQVERLEKSKASINVTYHDSQQKERLVMHVNQVFLALPPRLCHEYITFHPNLPTDVQTAMQSTRTWMAQQSKFIVEYQQPFWKESLKAALYWTQTSGPLDMIFENRNVIWGFVSHDKKWRNLPFEDLKVHVLQQLATVLGSEEAFNAQKTYEQDWTDEKYTCSTADALEPHPWNHPSYVLSSRSFQQRIWNGDLYFVGSETSAENAGFLDGAISAATAGVKRFLSFCN